LFVSSATFAQTAKDARPRARDIGITIGILPTGANNAITDVRGVTVGQTTIIKGENVRTGVTAILPHNGNLFKEKVPGAVFIGNGFGKLAGSTQVNELGEIETPILLTSTLSVPKTADFLMDYMLGLPGNEQVRSINPLVAETNDGSLNDIRGRHVTRDDVFNALRTARGGPIDEAPSALELGLWLSAGKAESERRRENCRKALAAILLACWSNRISAVS